MIGNDMRLMADLAIAISAADIFSKSIDWISSRSDHVSVASISISRSGSSPAPSPGLGRFG